MNNWIKHPVKLEGEKVLLLPLEEKHFEELIHAGNDERIWEHNAVNGTDKEKLREALNEALVKRAKGEQYPFVIIDRKNNKIIGSTRFLNLNEEHKKLEVGWTWYVPEYWGSGYNEECKLLVLTHCFEELKTIRVEIATRENNIRSRKAIEKIGGKFEGIFRNFAIRNGKRINAAFYSIVEEEWSETKKKLIGLCRK